METAWPAQRPSVWPVWLWTCGLCALLLAPGDAFDHPTNSWLLLLPQSADKWVHALLFAGETFWLERYLRFRQPRPLLLAAGLAAALAMLTELGQSVAPGRDPALGDLVANLVGITTGTIALRLAAKRIR